MKFKVSKGTETYNKLMALKDKAASVTNAAKKLVKEIGAKEWCRKQRVAYGGISAVEFAVKPDGWRMVGEKYQHLYYPKSNQKQLLKDINDLPVVTFNEVNEIVGFKAPQFVGLRFVSCVGIAYGKNYVLIETAEGAEYKPPKDVVEILESEYQRLFKKPRIAK